ncbi:glycoside hydrolase family 30 protein [Oleiharenicola lentus]|uniref:glycoside hydrolase family 30 protein n=1 Tax=Oleiharenicola lentus TaxID=2508720 RepID=UPI003F666499
MTSLARLMFSVVLPPAIFWNCGLLLLLGALTSTAAEPRRVNLPRPDAGPAFDGWGTSLCWFANAVGRWPEPQRSQIADALFSADGLGLTVVRYNIGGGDHPEHRHLSWFRQIDGFAPKAGTWDWAADPGQRWMLNAAIKRGAKRLEAFSNSPPYWMTLSQCASGGADPNIDNLDPRHEAAFAEYLAEVVEHFRDAWGVRFDTLAPLNEPFTDYWRANGNQEGCHFERPTQARLIRHLRSVLDQRGLNSVKISAADENNYDRAIETWKSYDAATRDCVAQINAHAYAIERRSELRDLAGAAGKPLVMSEVDGGGGQSHDHAAMGPALALAGQIIDDLRDLQPLRWVFWQAVEDEAGAAKSSHNWGLIHADLGGDSHVWTATKKYHAMGHFSKFIRPGAVLVKSDAPGTAAAWDDGRKELVIVASNPSPVALVSDYDCAAFGEGSLRVETYQTSAREDLAPQVKVTGANGRFSVTTPAQSITTYVVRWGETAPRP